MSSNSNERERVAVIGCGPSGICLLSAFNQLEKKGEPIPEIVCFEKQDTIGGLWNYTWHTGTDKYGEQCHNSMYRNLWTNGAKEVLEMSDYTFAEHFGKPTPSFPPRAVLADYVNGKAKKNDVERFVRVNTIVRNVEQKENQVVVTSQDLVSKVTKKETFDYLIVATGHFSVPYVPVYPGLDDFDGEIIHCHDLRDAARYKGKKVLVIGNGYSAEDVALVCYKCGVKEITISYRTKPTEFKWPEGVKEIPQLVKFADGLFHFDDEGTTDKFDVIIFCTGYRHQFTFLPDELRLETENSFFIDGLYKGVVFNKQPRVMYLGMQNQYYTFSMFGIQACFVRDYILGKVDIKSESERSEDIKLWNERFLEIKDAHDEINYQRDYLADVIGCCDCPEDHNDKRAEIMHQWKNDRAEDISGYRDKSFTSVMTGDVAPLPTIPWIQNMNDSFEKFLSAA